MPMPLPDIHEIARLVAMNQDPRTAYQLLRAKRIRKDFKMVFNFATGAEGDFVEQQLFGKGLCDVCVYGLSYTIRRPNYMEGSAFKSQEDAAFLQVPYMSAFLEIDSCPDIVITDNAQALELVATPASLPQQCCGPVFCLWALDTLKMRLTLDRDFAETEIPMTVTVVAHTLMMPGVRCCGDVSVEEAIDFFAKEFELKIDPKTLKLREE